MIIAAFVLCLFAAGVTFAVSISMIGSYEQLIDMPLAMALPLAFLFLAVQLVAGVACFIFSIAALSLAHQLQIL